MFAGALLVMAAASAPSAGAVDVGPVHVPLPPVTTPLTPPPARTEAQPAVAAAAAGAPLSGLFSIAAGACSSGGVTSGSYFRMIQPGGSQTGPFVGNGDSKCGDNTFSALSPGSDGGLSTTGYQAQPNPPFDSGGNGKAAAIIQPVKFFGVNFAMSTNATDPQTNTKVPVPSLTNSGGSLGGDIRAISVAWNNQQFNQGSPKPDGTKPGVTAGPSGTYNAGTGAFVLDWTSLIVGGPFNGFGGKWHFEGTFKAAATGSTTPGTSGGVAAQGTSGGSSAGVAGSAAGATTGSGSSGTSVGAANTGPLFPPWVGFALLIPGAAGLVLTRRRGHQLLGRGDPR